MFPGITTKLSEELLVTAATIQPRADLVKLTGATSIATISGQFGGGFSGILFIVPTTDAVATLTTGNISLAVTMPVDRVTVLVFSKATQTWYPGAIS